MPEHFGYIYKFTNLVTSKIYIGKRQSNTFDKYYYGSGKTWKQDLQLYGKNNIQREVIGWYYDYQSLLEAEKYWIKYYDARNPSVGYNIHKGGYGGNSLNDKEAWSKLHSGERNGRWHKEVKQETRDKISAANTGQIRSDEFKRRVSDSLKGKKKPEDFGKKISMAQKGRVKSDIEMQHLREALHRSQPKRTASLTGLKSYNNGEKEIHINPSISSVPDGFVLGRLKGHHSLKVHQKWINNGIFEKHINQGDELPCGWVYGRLSHKS